MNILIAEDDAVSRRLLSAFLTKWGYNVVAASDGAEAWQLLEQPDAPPLAVLDWMMPNMDGLEVCRRVRSLDGHPVYLIMLTARNRREDVVQALEAGADDYVGKPFDQAELRARVHVGARLVGLQRQLAGHVSELQLALSRVAQLEGLIPICAYCKRVRNDDTYWQQVESYIADHSGARFSHGVCPDCYEKLLEELPAGREEGK